MGVPKMAALFEVGRLMGTSRHGRLPLWLFWTEPDRVEDWISKECH